VTPRTRDALALPVLVVLGVACTATATVDRALPPSSTAVGSTTALTIEPDTESKEQQGPVTSSVTTVSGSESRATVSTDAGQIRARYAGGRLDVEIDSEPGWTPVVHRASATRLEVAWASDRGSVQTELEARDGGISATTRSVATG
jgi:hypothetical protein